MNINAELLKAYFDSYFFINNELSFTEFAVITAWNPYSKQVSNSNNQNANRQLKQHFLKQNYESLQVGDINRNWIEESFAVEIDLAQAQQLGKLFRQNAIYYVADDRLYLVSCLEQSIKKQHIGCFSQRIVKLETSN